MLLMLLGSAQASGVYKCTLEGRTVFTDRPCFSDEPPIDLPPVNHEAAVPAPSGKELAKRYDQRISKGKAARDKADAAFVKQQQDASKRADTNRAAILDHRVLKGMTASEVKSALGEPDSIDASGTWLFHGDGKRTTIQFDAKGVSKVQSKSDQLSNKKKNGRSHRR